MEGRTPDKVRVGVIGVGFGARVHIPAFQSEGLEVVAVCARRSERAREAAERFGIPQAFTDHREMLQMDGLDAVSVAGPPVLHYPMVMAALEAGKHVLCEKPFSTDQGRALEMWEKAKSTGVTAMIAHEYRFASARMRAKQLIDEGYLGPLHMVLMRVAVGPRAGLRPRPLSDWDDAAQGSGILWAVGSHYIDCVRHWFGEITTVSGQVFTHFGDRVHPESGATVKATADDTFHFVLHFAGGGWATMTGTTAAPYGSGGHIEMYGRDGTLVTPHVGMGVDPPAHGTLLGAKLGDEGLTQLPIPAELQPFADDRDERLMPFRLLVREFLRGIREGSSPSPNFYDGFRCQQVLDAVRESSAAGQVVQIALEE